MDQEKRHTHIIVGHRRNSENRDDLRAYGKSRSDSLRGHDFLLMADLLFTTDSFIRPWP